MIDNADSNKTLSAAYPETGISNLVGDPNQAACNAASAYDLANKLTTAAKDYNALNSVVNQLIGYEVKWFRAVPQQRSKDVIFQEYTLSNVEECPLAIKVVVPNGQIPDSKYNYDLMGLEYEVPLEVQIDKKYWECIAGFGTAPQKKDIIYFPLPNKLYEVESAYLFRGFMEQETAWKLNLKKYQFQASRRESADLQSTIDQYTVSVEEIFGEAIDNDVKKLVDDTQMNQFNSTSKDKYKSFDASLNIISTAVNMYGTTVAQSFFDMQTSNSFDAITYNAVDLIGNHTDRSLIAWTMPKDIIDDAHREYQIGSIRLRTYPYVDPSTLVSANYDIIFNSPMRYEKDDTLVIYREGAINFYATIIYVDIAARTYYCKIDDAVIEHLNSIKSDWANQTGYKVKIKDPINIIDGTNSFGSHTFTANIYANQYIKINYGAQEYIAVLDDRMLNDEWYGIIINIGNLWKQYNVYVWKKHETDENAKLQIYFYETIPFVPEETSITNFTVNKSLSYLTNLRIYNCTIEEERQSNELLSYFTKDGDKIILADQADVKMRIPYITRQR
jgi:hypothetical protein